MTPRSPGPLFLVLLLTLLVAPVRAGVPARASEVPARGVEAIERVRLVLDDGTVVEAREPISVKDSVVTFRLADGSLASLSVDRVVSVDLESMVWKVSSTPGSTREEKETPTPKRSFTNEDLPALAAGEAPSAASPVLDERAEELPPLSYDTYRDRKGRDEAWWRERVAGLEAEMAEAEREAEKAYEDLGVVNRRYRRGAEASGARTSGNIKNAQARLDQALARWEALQAEWNELEREARQSGALPGWFR